MLKNVLISAIFALVIVLFVVTRTEKKVVPQALANTGSVYFTMRMDKPLKKIRVLFSQSEHKQNTQKLIDEVLCLAQKDLNVKDLKFRYDIKAIPIIQDTKKVQKTFFEQNKKQNPDAFIWLDEKTHRTFNPLLVAKNDVVNVLLPLQTSNLDLNKSLLDLVPSDTLSKKTMRLLYKKGCRRVVFIGSENFKNTGLEKQFMQAALEQKMVFKTVWFENKNISLEALKVQNFRPDGYVLLSENNGRQEILEYALKLTPNIPIIHLGYLDTFSSNQHDEIYFIDLPTPKPSILNLMTQNKKTPAEELLRATVYDSILLTVKAFEKTDGNKEAVNYLKKMSGYMGVSGYILQNSPGVFSIMPEIRKVIHDKAYVIDN